MPYRCEIDRDGHGGLNGKTHSRTRGLLRTELLGHAAIQVRSEHPQCRAKPFRGQFSEGYVWGESFTPQKSREQPLQICPRINPKPLWEIQNGFRANVPDAAEIEAGDHFPNICK